MSISEQSTVVILRQPVCHVAATWVCLAKRRSAARAVAVAAADGHGPCALAPLGSGRVDGAGQHKKHTALPVLLASHGVVSATQPPGRPPAHASVQRCAAAPQATACIADNRAVTASRYGKAHRWQCACPSMQALTGAGAMPRGLRSQTCQAATVHEAPTIPPTRALTCIPSLSPWLGAVGLRRASPWRVTCPLLLLDSEEQPPNSRSQWLPRACMLACERCTRCIGIPYHRCPNGTTRRAPARSRHREDPFGSRKPCSRAPGSESCAQHATVSRCLPLWPARPQT